MTKGYDSLDFRVRKSLMYRKSTHCLSVLTLNLHYVQSPDERVTASLKDKRLTGRTLVAYKDTISSVEVVAKKIFEEHEYKVIEGLVIDKFFRQFFLTKSRNFQKRNSKGKLLPRILRVGKSENLLIKDFLRNCVTEMDLRRLLRFYGEIDATISQGGAPDLFVYSPKKESWFFVEIKSISDSIGATQWNWIAVMQKNLPRRTLLLRILPRSGQLHEYGL